MLSRDEPCRSLLTAVNVLDFADRSALVLEAGRTAGTGRVGGHCILFTVGEGMEREM